MKPKSFLFAVLAFFLAAAGAFGETRPASAAPAGLTFAVNITTDATDKSPGDGVCETDTGNGLCSLRAAVMEANAYIGIDTIVIPADTFTLTISGINEDSAATGDLDITNSVNLVGAGPTATVIQWSPFAQDSNRDRVLEILGAITVNISGVAIRNGYVEGQPSGAGILSLGATLTVTDSLVVDNRAEQFGGGLENMEGNVTIQASTFTANHALDGGAIFSFGELVLTDSTITGNMASDIAGGIQIYYGTATLTGNTISGNSAGFQGGGIYMDGVVTIANSTISGNSANKSDGGGIYNARALTLINSTVSGNWAKRHGGGINNYTVYNDAALNLYNATITGNTADSDHDNDGNGGGIFVAPNVPAQISDSIIALNFDGSPNAPFLQPHDCAGSITSLGYNLLRNSTGCAGFTANQNGDLVGTYFSPVNPLLGALADNGGATQTQALLVGSPARDAGNASGCANGQGGTLTADQRGFARPSGARCDIGAFEAAPPYQVFVPLVVR